MVFTVVSFAREDAPDLPSETPNVLVVNSYHSGFRWTEAQVDGIVSAIEKNVGLDADVYIEYMDTKRFTPGYNRNYQFKNFLAEKYGNVPFSAVVVTDNNALTFMLDYHKDLFPMVPVVACGISGDQNLPYPGHFQIIREDVDLTKLVDMALTLFPRTKNVILLGDGTTTSQVDFNLALKALEKYPDLKLVPLNGRGMSFKDVLHSIKLFQDQSICLFTGFWQDKEGRKMESRDVIRAAALHTPVFVWCEGYFQPEVVGGLIVSGTDQGRAAGEAVVGILRAVPGKERPVNGLKNQPGKFVLNYPVLRKYSIPIEKLPDDVILAGKPGNTFLQNYGAIILFSGVVVCLLALLILLASRDLCHHAETTAALKKVEQELTTVFESISDGLILTDAGGKVEQINLAACKLIGCTKDESIGCDLLDIYQVIEASSHQPAKRSFTDIIDQVETYDGAPEQRLLISGNKEEHVIAESGSVIRGIKAEIRGLVVIFRDISEDIQQQEERQHSQKMEAMGKLAGGVSHDFNNLLTSIIGNAELLRMSLEEDEESIECAEHIIKASSRAADLTSQLLAFSRKGKQAKFKPVNVHDLVDDVMSLLEHSIDRRIKLLKKKDSFRHWTMGDASQLQNAFLNMGINARDAMPEGGTLSFTTRDVVIAEDEVHTFNNQLKPGKYIDISIEDTGRGIDQKLRERVFEPFFTTKPEGKGTGLGLAVVYGIIRTHHGHINLKSHPGQGTTFSILLPVCKAPGSDIKPLGSPKFRSIREGHVLIVDDEEAIRSLLKKMLKQMGFKVNVCSDGQEAVNYYTRHSAEIDLVIMDLMMPRMGGADAFERIRKVDPAAKVLIISGYSKSKVVESLMDAGALGFISKPFHVKEFSDKVRQYIG